MIEAAFQRPGEKWADRLVRTLSPPPEYFHARRYRTSDREPDSVSLHRVDGMWTDDEFHEIRRAHVFTITVAAEASAEA